MLKLKPNCELCDVDLPPNASNARICTYECTFCSDCVDAVLMNVCPNCGGGLCERPLRPANEHREGVSLLQHPASTERVFTSLSRDEIELFSACLSAIAPSER